MVKKQQKQIELDLYRPRHAVGLVVIKYAGRLHFHFGQRSYHHPHVQAKRSVVNASTAEIELYNEFTVHLNMSATEKGL